MTRFRTRSVGRAVVVGTILAAVAGAWGVSAVQSKSASSAASGTLVVDRSFEIKTADPQRAFEPTASIVDRGIYDTFFTATAPTRRGRGRPGGPGRRSVARSSELASGVLASARKVERRVASSAAARAACSRGQRDPLLGLALHLLRHPVQLDEDLHLGAQDLGHDRREDVVDRAERIALGRVHLVGEGGDEDDRRVRRSACGWRISAAVSKPSMSGMLTSSRMTANSRSQHCAALPRPSAP